MSAPEDKRKEPNDPPESTFQEQATSSNVPTTSDAPGPSQCRSIIARIIDKNTSRIANQFTSSTDRNVAIEPSNQRTSTELALLPRERTATSYFNISTENFPLLPDPKHSYHRRSITAKPSTSKAASSACVPSTSNASKSDKKEIIVHPNGKVTNILSSVLNDQYGIMSILAMIRMGSPSLSHLCLGMDLNTLGIDGNSGDLLYPRFGGAFAYAPLNNHNMTVSVPREYLMNNAIERKISPLNLNILSEDTLFYLFYICIREKVQLEVAVVLFNRQWRFHKDMKVWFRRAVDRVVYRRMGNKEEGLYHYFDPKQWKMVSDYLIIHDHQVEGLLNLNFCKEFIDRKHLFF